MGNQQFHLLTVNAGSSSIKLALFALDNPGQKISEATLENIGLPSACLKVDGEITSVSADNHAVAIDMLIRWVEKRIPVETIAAVGHRIVHGGPKYYKPQLVSDELLADLQNFIIFDPEHLPVELQLITTFRSLFGQQVLQVACFDTAFHHNLPMRAQLLPIPRQLNKEGVRRYGFHGLSYAYILDELRRVEGETAANGKVIIAHLGSGASLTAVCKGASIDTTMSLTPASGITMSTRSGDLDPGLALYLHKTQGYDAAQFNHMANFESGLLGISETTADMKKLLEIESSDERARDAIDMFCYQAKKTIGSFAAALGGLNTLVFTGGMGENAPKIRARICEELEFLGIRLDAERNESGARLISVDDSGVGVHVIHTDESMTIAQETARLLQKK